MRLALYKSFSMRLHQLKFKAKVVVETFVNLKKNFLQFNVDKTKL